MKVTFKSMKEYINESRLDEADVYKKLLAKAKKASKGKDEKFIKNWIKVNVTTDEYAEKLEKELMEEYVNEAKPKFKISDNELVGVLKYFGVTLSKIENMIDKQNDKLDSPKRTGELFLVDKGNISGGEEYLVFEYKTDTGTRKSKIIISSFKRAKIW